ncbi:translation initiation factor IF-2-like isoform X1 [Canis lupus familiaris]|uniref:translation initiation factor IF-2-like isoform X1 n=1 Tax=Canis lupus familiaris TaxID=9615 RepID=UPI0018F556C1|nr:translation initiation factor IF-2-like isoform X1 [Canis lupus familiaris]
MEEAPRNSGLVAATLRLRRPRSLPGGVSGSYVQPQHPLPTTFEGVPRPLRWPLGTATQGRTRGACAWTSALPGRVSPREDPAQPTGSGQAAPTPLLWPIRPDPAPPTAAGLPPDSLPAGTWGRAPRHAEGEVPAPEGSPGNQGEQAHGATSGFPLRVPCRGPTSPRGKGPAPWALSVVLVVIPGVSSPSLRVCKQSAGERLARILRSASRAGRDSGTSKLLVSKVPQFPRPPQPHQHCRTAEPSADGKGRAKCQKFPPETVEGVFVGFSLPLACRKPQGNKTPAEMPRPPPAGGAWHGCGCELRPPAPCPLPSLPTLSPPGRGEGSGRPGREGSFLPQLRLWGRSHRSEPWLRSLWGEAAHSRAAEGRLPGGRGARTAGQAGVQRAARGTQACQRPRDLKARGREAKGKSLESHDGGLSASQEGKTSHQKPNPARTLALDF